MDKKDEIILQQLETIRAMTERNLRSMGGDFWGTPFENVTGAPEKKPASKDDGGKPAAAQPAEKKADEPEPLPKENLADLQAELDSYIGLADVKEEVKNLINMAQHGRRLLGYTV